MNLSRWLSKLFGRDPEPTQTPVKPVRTQMYHVVVLDGTMSSLKEGCETNVGQTYKLLLEAAKENHQKLSIYYEPGLQWTDLRSGWNVMIGRGINRQIKRAYGFLASRYRPGDKIVLIGFSRGAYAVRSLAGVIDLVGLLRSDAATERNIRQAYRHYETNPRSVAADAFQNAHCHEQVDIEAVSVWDTVKALGLVFPVIWRISEKRHAFHNDMLGKSVANGFHALALDERRVAYSPVMWATDPTWDGNMEQVWFRGTHADVGGQLDGFDHARPLANISLVWMLQRLEMCGLIFPSDWRERFDTNPNARSVGAWRGWAKMFLTRRARTVGEDPSEQIHSSVKRKT